MAASQGKALAGGRPDGHATHRPADKVATVAATQTVAVARMMPSQPVASNPLLEWARARQKQAAGEKLEGRLPYGPVQPVDETSERIAIDKD
ncbi:MAG: hypothetical protein JWQ98_3283 [Chlorobi bacterium]|nr:hypothetical protein [Chlorobiota bacterium]